MKDDYEWVGTRRQHEGMRGNRMKEMGDKIKR